MEYITSRKNRIITHLRSLESDAAYRGECREYVCDGEKLLKEALSCGARVKTVLWRDEPAFKLEPSIEQYSCPEDLMQYASPLKNSRGPVFSVAMRDCATDGDVRNALILENVQDPGNVGTVLRTANALGIDLVVLTGACADVFNPKTVRSTMGAVFRQRVMTSDIGGIRALADKNGLKLYGAALSETSEDIRKLDMINAAVAIGSEGGGLSDEFLSVCDGHLIIPMQPCSESLNAAVAASIVMWEMSKNSAGEE